LCEQARREEGDGGEKVSDDLFPDSQRVIYERHPLTQVICQLRFPPLLKIEGEPPAEFQERIRTLYPLLERATRVALPSNLPREVAQLLGAAASGVNYQFLTENRENTLGLAPDSISLTTTNYARWENFWDLLKPALAAFVDIYRPSFFVRIGLRYQNAIQREAIGLSGYGWSDLLRPEIAGELVVPHFEENLQEVQRVLRMRTPSDDCGVLLQHGLGVVEGRGENCYLIDFDFYVDRKTGVQDAEPILNRFHRRAGRAFRWCIKRTLHDALGPTSLEDA
jgi:uncharacterized protein (TIGR04255 family)